jgi:catechol 2,3-dioxygenase-like lactoylglutathione lyase family enzyme
MPATAAIVFRAADVADSYLYGNDDLLASATTPWEASKTPMILGIDHFVLTVRSLEVTLDFYERVLGMRRSIEPGRPASLLFGTQKINVHESGHTFEPKARHPMPGGADFCLFTDAAPEETLARLAGENVPVELGPVERTGARGKMISIYFRDPDGNLVEVSRYSGS